MASDFAGDWAGNPQYQQRIAQLLPQIQATAKRYGLPADAIPYMLANYGIESRFNVNSGAGRNNDIGGLQITPILAKEYGVAHTTDPATQLDVLGRYYQRNLGKGLSLQNAATGWNTGEGRAAQVQRGQRDWASITPMAANYSNAVNNFVASQATQNLLSNNGINYTNPGRTPAVAKTLQQYNIHDTGPQPMQASIPSLMPGLTGNDGDIDASSILNPTQPQQQQTAQTNQPLSDLKLDGILTTDLGLGERLF